MNAQRTKTQLAKFRNFIRTINMQQDHGSLDLDNPSHVAFVITDLENSTACAAADRRAYRDVQVVHDQVRGSGVLSARLPTAGRCHITALPRSCESTSRALGVTRSTRKVRLTMWH